jgi:molecular chaperone GrpE
MTRQPQRRKPAGAPERERRPAGAPEQERRPAGAPDRQPAAGAADEERRGGAHPEAEADQRQDSEAAAREVERDLEELEKARRERDEYLDLARRTKADFENYRKRAAGEAEAARRRGKAELAEDLLPALDSLESALTAAGVHPSAADAPSDEGGGAAQLGDVERGILLTYQGLRATLERNGVEAYDPTGEKFDPEWHEAVSTRPADGAEPGTVVDVVQKGYRLDGQVIRAARVVVSE